MRMGPPAGSVRRRGLRQPSLLERSACGASRRGARLTHRGGLRGMRLCGWGRIHLGTGSPEFTAWAVQAGDDGSSPIRPHSIVLLRALTRVIGFGPASPRGNIRDRQPTGRRAPRTGVTLYSLSTDSPRRRCRTAIRRRAMLRRRCAKRWGSPVRQRSSSGQSRDRHRPTLPLRLAPTPRREARGGLGRQRQYWRPLEGLVCTCCFAVIFWHPPPPIRIISRRTALDIG